MKQLLLPLGLQIAFFIVLLLEMILPSGGILAIMAVGLLVGSWFIIMGSGIAGAPLVFLVADVIMIPICIVIGIKLMRKSPLSNRTELDSAAGFQVSVGLAADLVGQVGQVVTTLRPSGKVQIGHQVLDALSTGDFIAAGSRIVVTSVTENKLMVEMAEPDAIVNL
jgi:membrane-bound serine protease (ClpP class)